MSSHSQLQDKSSRTEHTATESPFTVIVPPLTSFGAYWLVQTHWVYENTVNWVPRKAMFRIFEREDGSTAIFDRSTGRLLSVIQNKRLSEATSSPSANSSLIIGALDAPGPSGYTKSSLSPSATMACSPKRSVSSTLPASLCSRSSNWVTCFPSASVYSFIATLAPSALSPRQHASLEKV